MNIVCLSHGLVWVNFMELWGLYKCDDFHYTGWIIGIPRFLILAYCYPYPKCSMYGLYYTYIWIV